MFLHYIIGAAFYENILKKSENVFVHIISVIP